MITFIRIILFSALGAILSTITALNNWQYWAILICAICIGILGNIEGEFFN